MNRNLFHSSASTLGNYIALSCEGLYICIWSPHCEDVTPNPKYLTAQGRTTIDSNKGQKERLHQAPYQRQERLQLSFKHVTQLLRKWLKSLNCCQDNRSPNINKSLWDSIRKQFLSACTYTHRGNNKRPILFSTSSFSPVLLFSSSPFSLSSCFLPRDDVC